MRWPGQLYRKLSWPISRHLIILVQRRVDGMTHPTNSTSLLDPGLFIYGRRSRKSRPGHISREILPGLTTGLASLRVLCCLLYLKKTFHRSFSRHHTQIQRTIIAINILLRKNLFCQGNAGSYQHQWTWLVHGSGKLAFCAGALAGFVIDRPRLGKVRTHYTKCYIHLFVVSRIPDRPPRLDAPSLRPGFDWRTGRTSHIA